MTKKHFIWGANYILNEMDSMSPKPYFNKFEDLRSYIVLTALFKEFGDNFNQNKFDEYIKKRTV